MQETSARRFFVTMAVDKYQHLPADGQLRRPSADAARIAALLTPSGYQQALPGLGEYSAVEHVRTKLSDWSKDIELGGDDAVVFYYAGHGLVRERDRHYLMCWSSREDDPDATALPTEDLIRILTRTGLRNLLVVLDTCYGGVGAADGVQLVLRTLARRFDDTAGSGGVWMLSSARSRDEAEDGAFVDCLVDGLQDARARTGQRQRYLDLGYLVEAVNRQFEHRRLRQRAELAAGVVTGVAPFLDNEAYNPGLPSGDTDLTLQRRLARGELHDHFGPRARGVEFDSEPGLYFSGRERAMSELVTWLTGADDDRGRVVTGKPGCGKSAVLGRIVAMSDPTYRQDLLREEDPAAAEVTPRLVDVWVHARHKLLPEIVDRIAADLDMAADSPGQLLRLINHRAAEHGPIVIVVDALDEAGAGAESGGKHEPRRIARELLRPLAEISGVRLLVGTRHELVSSLGTDMTVLDLDEPRYLGDEDVAGYVTKVLLAENEPEVRTPYRGRPELARQVGETVSDRASGVFLVARMTARGLRKADAPVDVTMPGWQEALPSEIDQAFEAYLDRYGPHRNRVRALLTPLAFAEGQGLPRGVLWLNTAARLADRDFREEDVDWLLDEAGDYIAEVVDNGHSVYRLYHQSLAEHLRATYHLGITEAQRRIVEAVLPTVPTRSDGAPDWFAAHRYLRAHLSTHAAAAGRLDELAEQPGFLLVAEQLALLKAFAKAASESGGSVRSAYEQAAHQLVESVPLAERAAYLQLSARRCRADHLADRIDVPMPWRTAWAWWSPTGAHRQLVGHDSSILAVSTGSMDGRAVAVTSGDDGTARVWDLMTRRPLGEPFKPGSDAVTALASCEIGDYVVLVTGGDDGRLQAWDLSTGKMLGEPLTGHTNSITSIAIGVVAGNTTVAVSGSRDGTARVWDLSDPSAGTQLGSSFVKHRSAVNAVALAELDGAMVVLSGGDDKRVHVWDVLSQEQFGESLIGHTRPVTALATLGRTVITGSMDYTIGLWDLRTRQQVGEPIAAHPFGVRALAVGELNGVPVAVSCGQTDAKVWNLNTRRLIGQPLAGHIGTIDAVAFGTVDRTPVAITGGFDRTARIWDLNADQPLAGHTDDVVSVAIGRGRDGRSLAVTGSEDTTAVVWDLEREAQDGAPLAGHRTTVTAVALGDNDGRPVVVTGGEDALVHIWDLDTRQPIGPVLGDHTGPITTLEFGAVDGDTVLVTGSRDGTVRLWDPATGAAIGDPLLGHNADVQHVILSEVDNRPLVFAASWTHITGWDVRSREKLGLDSSRTRGMRVLSIGHAAGRSVAIIQANDNSVLRWDILSCSTIGDPLVAHTDYITSAVICERAGIPVALTSSRDLTVRTWDLRNGSELGVPLAREEYFSPAIAAGPVTDGTVAITLGRKQVRLWSLQEFQQIGEPLCGADMDIGSLAIGAANGRTVIVCGCDDGPVRIRDLASGQLVGPLLNGHWAKVSGSAVTDLDGPVAITTDHSMARVWDLTTYRERFRWTHSERGGLGLLALSRCDGRQLAVTTDKTVAHVWELTSQTHLAELAGHTGEIRAVATAECGDVPMVLTGSRDTTARLWNTRTCELVCAPLTGHEGDVNAVTFGELDGQPIAFTGDDDGVVRGWDPHTGDRVDLPIPEVSDWVTALAFGTLRNEPVLAISAADGTVLLWSGSTRETLAEIQLQTAPRDMMIHSNSHLCIATAMGVVVLQFGDWA